MVAHPLYYCVDSLSAGRGRCCGFKGWGLCSIGKGLDLIILIVLEGKSMENNKNGKAIASMVLGIVGLVFVFFGYFHRHHSCNCGPDPRYYGQEAAAQRHGYGGHRPVHHRAGPVCNYLHCLCGLRRLPCVSPGFLLLRGCKLNSART